MKQHKIVRGRLYRDKIGNKFHEIVVVIRKNNKWIVETHITIHEPAHLTDYEKWQLEDIDVSLFG